MTVDEYIDGLAPTPRRIASELRRLVKEAAPTATETIKWGMPVYEMQGNICYIGAIKDRVNFGFYRGADLPDPVGLLEGTGKKLRHIKVRSIEDIQEAAFKVLVEGAVRVNAE